MSYRLPLRDIAAFLRRQDDGQTWVPDAVLNVKIDARWKATDHPVESGLSVSDHVQSVPQTVVLTCVVTETPGGLTTGGRTRIRKALAWLRETADNRQLVDIYTQKLGRLRNYVITAAPTGIDKVNRLQFDLELKEIRLATVTTIEITVDEVDDEVAADAPDEVDVGEQATTSTSSTTAEAAQEEQDQSLLSALLEAL